MMDAYEAVSGAVLHHCVRRRTLSILRRQTTEFPNQIFSVVKYLLQLWHVIIQDLFCLRGIV